MAQIGTSYNDGLYTPDTTYVGYSATDVAPAVTSDIVQPTTSTPASVAATTTPASSTQTTSSSAAAAQYPGISFASLASSLTYTSSASSSSSSASSSSSKASSITLSRPSLASNTTTASSSTFKITYLLPVFIIVPALLLIATISFCVRRNRRIHHEGVLSAEEEDGLVKGRFVKGSDGGSYLGNEKAYPTRNVERTSSWTSFVPASLRRVLTSSPDQEPSGPSGGYTNLDRPFIPPSISTGFKFRAPNEEDEERGWAWGTAPSGSGVKRSESWRTWGNTTTKYRLRSGASISSRRSNPTSSTEAYESGYYGGTTPASPSIYSATDVGGYGMLDGDEEPTDEERSAALDRLLAESRVGDSELAKKYLSGKVTAADFPPASSVPQRQQSTYVPPPPVVDLPTAPRQTYVSPTKSAVVRARLPTPPRGAGDQRGLLFHYNNPVTSVNSADPAFFFSPAGGQSASYDGNRIHNSDSSFSLTGVQDLVYGEGPSELPYEDDEKEEHPQPRRLQKRRSKAVVKEPSDKTAKEDVLKGAQQFSVATTAPSVVVAPPSPRPPPTQPYRQSQDFFFSEPTRIPSLNHPSPVKRAIETLEKRSSADITPPSPQQQPPASPGRGVVRRYERPISLPVPPSSTKLERSTSVLQMERDTRDRLTSQREKEKAVGGLLMARSRTSMGLGPAMTPDPGQNSVHTRSQPMGPRAMSAGEPRNFDDTSRHVGTAPGRMGAAGGGGLEAMLRRTTALPPPPSDSWNSGLKSAMKH